MSIQSAGILLYRRRSSAWQVFLIHMGGPLWIRKDLGAWSIPKGVIGVAEDPLAAARREFFEETGFAVDGTFEPLGTFHQNRTKDLSIWALRGDCEPALLTSTMFSMIWPPKSGKLRQFPEADRGDWFGRDDAMVKIVAGQRKVLERLFADKR